MNKDLEQTSQLKVATHEDLEWLFTSSEYFEVEYNVPPGTLREEWQTLITTKKNRIIGYLSLEFFPQEEETYAWIRTMSMSHGYEGLGEGSKLIEYTKQHVKTLGYTQLQVWAHEPRAKKFYVKNDFSIIEGTDLETKGNTRLRVTLK